MDGAQRQQGEHRHGHLLMVTRLMYSPISDDPFFHELTMGSPLVPLPIPSLPHQACHQKHLHQTQTISPKQEFPAGMPGGMRNGHLQQGQAGHNRTHKLPII